ncbi:class I SAM-dependent methyltransferase [Magnetococcus sp. PR-3]|uniref:class I SAM-dependent methyltransferase n=1 Tax=Magnetococcus sp. PR-3 TaxID=3120355 RepID=UPI002FCE0DE2
MQQTPMHDRPNPDLLAMIPPHAQRILEVGCSSGALAKAHVAQHPQCDYVGLDVDPEYVQVAQQFCRESYVLDIEKADAFFYKHYADRECWIFGDALEHLKDPWAVLQKIRGVIPQQGCVLACIPNAQHWSLQLKLATGQFHYQPQGLLDRTHLRFFTRQTMVEMFESSGFQVAQVVPRIFPEPQRQTVLPIIGQLAALTGQDARQAMEAATPMQYILKAVPQV